VPAAGYPPAEEAKKPEEEEDDDAEEQEAEGAEAGKKKKRRRAKKKKNPEAGSGAKSAVVPDAEFDAWCAKVLEQHPLECKPEDAMKLPRNFIGHSFTGKLRPAFVAPRFKAPPGVDPPDYATHPQGVSLCEKPRPKEIPVVEGEELLTMREACRLGREILDIASRAVKVGVTGDYIDRLVYAACCERNCYPSPLGYYLFPKSVCTSVNEVICHGIPDCRPLQEGDIVNLDVSIYYKGFHSDLNETFFVGNCDEDQHRVVRAAYEALLDASKMIRPGTLYRDLGAVIQASAAKQGCSVVASYTGHGVGRLFHGPPNVPHYKKNKAVGIMKPGHVFTVEPMINLGGNGGDKLWPDNWTAVTKDGKSSSQFEHTFLVTETGVEVLTARPGAPTDCMPPYDPALFQR